ncbi:MAG: glycosyltransferase family 39 protein [Lentimicrobiaceae bacterium]|nr:glycosyltransferase family 39 protein [Lentimicrobiaceae bacterium]
MNKQWYKDNWIYLLIIVLLFFPVFQYIDDLAIRLWDESRLAINAYEMFHSGNYLIPTYEGEPDMWNTKPPLMIWLQVLAMKLFGINEFAIRLPSALAAFFTCISLLFFAVRYVKNFWLGFICALALVTTPAFINVHAARTGDYDALLTMLLTFSCFSFFSFLETSKNKYLYFFFLSLTLAFLTKSSAALMILPGLFIYVFIKKKIVILLKNRHLYIGLLGFVILGTGYFLLREIYNPGYIDMAWKNDFGGRFLDTLGQHKKGFWFYVIHRFNIWLLLIPFGIFTGLLNKDQRIKNLTLFTTITAVTFFLVISSAQTKLPWYALPLYPFISILAGVFIYYIFSFIKENRKLAGYFKYNIVPYVFVCVVFFAPYVLIFNKTYKPKEDVEDFYRTSYYLRDLLNGKRQGDNFTILYDEYSAPVLFYVNLLNENGKNITLRNSTFVKIGETVLTIQNQMKEFVEKNYDFNIVEQYENIVVYEILKEKQ